MDAAAAADAPPSSPNLHFRELDDEFMQKQAKIWLEAVLDDRFGDNAQQQQQQLQCCLADLLADGDILYRVSRSLKELLRATVGAPLLPETPSESKGGKYLPYSRVDSFLQVCKAVGLPDVDLFTPTDVVDKKDIRRVCLCIRALSKKARANNLQVPDFDKVAHAATLAMSTEKVGGIRDHLQQAAVCNSTPEPPRKPGKSASGNTSQTQSQGAEPVIGSKDDESRSLLNEFNQAEDGTKDDKKGGSGRIWLPLALGAAALALATSVVLVAFRAKPRNNKARGLVEVEVKEGDTLYKISRSCGKSNWKELLELNPNLVSNPDLIYPTDRLKLSS